MTDIKGIVLSILASVCVVGFMLIIGIFIKGASILIFGVFAILLLIIGIAVVLYVYLFGE